MSETRVRLTSARPLDLALPPLDQAQRAVLSLLEDARARLVVRAVPGAGRTTLALAALGWAAERGLDAVVWVPDRARADALDARARRQAPSAVRPVRTPAGWAWGAVNAWMLRRDRPLASPQLLTGARDDALVERLLRDSAVAWPPDLSEQMRTMPAFRLELRNLFARAGDAGVDADGLAALAGRLGQPQWLPAAGLLRAYDRAAQPPARPDDQPADPDAAPPGWSIDPARLQRLAARLLADWDRDAPAEGVRAARPAPGLVVVDDLQDCTLATVALLAQLARAGARVLALSCPDAATAAYRGGVANLDAILVRALDARWARLGPHPHRGTPALERLAQTVAGRISTVGPPLRAPLVDVDAAGAGSVTLDYTASQAQLGALLARTLRTHHVIDRIGWEHQCVIVRSGGDVESLRRALRRGGVPLSGRRRAVSFVDEGVDRVLLDLLAGDPGDRPVEERAALAGELLGSAYVDADALDLHRLLRALERARGAGAERPLDLADLLADPGLPARLGVPVPRDARAGLARAQQMWKRAGEAARGSRAGAQIALWGLWSAAGVAAGWRAQALAGGERGERADDDLDAVLALFRTADVWDERHPGGAPAQFAAELLASPVPTDNLARTGQRPPGVDVLTPAQAAGREWRVVCVAGLQEEHWPTRTLGDRVLRADRLAEATVREALEGAPLDAWDPPSVQRRAAQDREARLFLQAVTRSTQWLHLGAVRAQDLAPSAFVDWARPCARTRPTDAGGSEPVLDAEPPLTRVPPAFDLAGTVAALRHDAAQPAASPGRARATRLLALLAAAGERGADPREWAGVGGITTDAPVLSDGPVRVSPSRVELALACPLRWFLSACGGEPPAGDRQQLGTLIHAVAQRHPHGPADAMRADFERQWPALGVDDSTWAGRQAHARAAGMVDKLAGYMAGVPGPVETEVPVRLDLDGVRISGSIDRVEHVGGGVRIADIKTGRPISRDRAQANPQLSTYQVALAGQGLDVVGARLVYLGDDRPRATLRAQEALADEALEDARSRLRGLADLMRGRTFRATPSTEACRSCPFVRACPAKQQGRRTVE